MMQNRLKQIENTVTFGLLALFPVFLLPGLSNPFVTAKLFLLIAGLVTIFTLKAVRNLTSKTKGLVFNTSSLDLPVLLLTGAYLVSGYMRTPNRMEAFWLPGTSSFVIGGALLYFVLHQLTERNKSIARLSLIAGGALISVISMLVASGVLKGMDSLPAYARTDVFNPAGSVLVVALLLVALIPWAFEGLMKSENITVKAVSGVTLGLFALALVTSTIAAVKNWNQLQLPSLTTSWVVATESLKNSPFMGSGPGNYLSAYSRFIPLSNNASSLWGVRFGNANNYYLTAITETGLFGLAALVVLLLAFYRRFRSAAKDNNVMSIIPATAMVVILAIFPGTAVVLFFFFALLALSGRTHVVHMFTPAHESSEATTEGKVAAVIVAFPVLALAVFVSFLTLQAFRGEVVYQKALVAVGAQDGKTGYETLKKAINISPFNDRFHLTYAQLNLALANAISQKKDLTDTEKNTISQLIQQSIREGRAAVLLNKERATNWENLASTYKAVIPLAKGADQYAVQTYAQAVALDPTNPNTRLGLGGIYYGLKRYEEAIDVFKLAVATKPDLPNAHYNLAIAYRDNGQYDKALAELSGILTLVQQGTKDYDVVKKEIENVQSKAPKKEQTAQQTETLTPPTPIEENPDAQIELPQDATPPATPTTESSNQ